MTKDLATHPNTYLPFSDGGCLIGSLPILPSPLRTSLGVALKITNVKKYETDN
jgi:hypothetical protein